MNHIKVLDDFLDKSLMNSKIWRYMSLEKLEQILNTGKLYFASAEQFNNNDSHEGAITEEEYNNRKEIIKRTFKEEAEIIEQLTSLENAFKPLRKYNKISCWHLNVSESFSMWSYYQGKNKGIALASTIDNVCSSLGEYRIKPEYGIETINVGKANYIDYETESMNIKYGFLTPYFYKRKPYLSESEIRFIISLRIASEFGVEVPEFGIEVPFDYKSAITEIIISPDANQSDIDTLKELLDSYDWDIEVKKSLLAKRPRF